MNAREVMTLLSKLPKGGVDHIKFKGIDWIDPQLYGLELKKKSRSNDTKCVYCDGVGAVLVGGTGFLDENGTFVALCEKCQGVGFLSKERENYLRRHALYCPECGDIVSNSLHPSDWGNKKECCGRYLQKCGGGCSELGGNLHVNWGY